MSNMSIYINHQVATRWGCCDAAACHDARMLALLEMSPVLRASRCSRAVVMTGRVFSIFF